MIRSLWIAKTGLDAQQTQMDVISNNLANVSTNGFKSSRAVFEDLLYQNVRQPGAQSSQQTQLPSGLQLGTGVRAVATERIFTQGNLQQTGNSQTSRSTATGFFQVLMPDGTTGLHPRRLVPDQRAGPARHVQRLQVQPADHDAQQRAVADDRQRRHGRRSRGRAAPPPTQVGTLQLATSSTRPASKRKGENLYVETASSGTPNASTPGLNGAGIADAGLRRDLERQRRRGAGQHDPDPARLRDQLEGDHRRPTRCCRSCPSCEAATHEDRSLHSPLRWSSRCRARRARALATLVPAAASCQRADRRAADDAGRRAAAPAVANGAIYQRGHATGRCSRTSRAAPRRRHPDHRASSRRRQRDQEVGAEREQQAGNVVRGRRLPGSLAACSTRQPVGAGARTSSTGGGRRERSQHASPARSP